LIITAAPEIHPKFSCLSDVKTSTNNMKVTPSASPVYTSIKDTRSSVSNLSRPG
jgi:hypothetical protein